MLQQCEHLRLLHFFDEKTRSLEDENFDRVRISLIFLGRLYAIIGLYECSSFTLSLFDNFSKSQYLFIILPIFGKDVLTQTVKGITGQLSFSVGCKASNCVKEHT